MTADAYELVRLSTVLLVDSLVVTHVEFPTFLSFESETCRASVVWETRGCHEWRILLRQRENYWGSRTVGASCGSLYVTVLGRAAYKGAQYLVRVWRGSRRDLTRLRRLL